MATDELLLKLLGSVKLFAGLGRADLPGLLACAEKAGFAEGTTAVRSTSWWREPPRSSRPRRTAPGPCWR